MSELTTITQNKAAKKKKKLQRMAKQVEVYRELVKQRNEREKSRRQTSQAVRLTDST